MHKGLRPMRGMIVALTLALASPTALAAAPQRVPMNMGAMTPMTEAALASHVGDWIYDADGSIVGSSSGCAALAKLSCMSARSSWGAISWLLYLSRNSVWSMAGSLYTTRLWHHWRPCRHCLSRRPVTAALPLNMREALSACSAAKSSL